MTSTRTKIASSGSLAIDPTKLDSRDLFEGAAMLQASATLLRQSFGIVSMTNSLLDKPFSEDDLKSMAARFDAIHKLLNTCAVGIKSFIDSRYGKKSE